MKRGLDHDTVHDAVTLTAAAAPVRVRYEADVTRGQAEHAVLPSHTGVTVEMQADTDAGVRLTAVHALGKRQRAARPSHTGAIADMLADSDEGVRYAAAVAIGRLEPAALKLHA